MKIKFNDQMDILRLNNVRDTFNDSTLQKFINIITF